MACVDPNKCLNDTKAALASIVTESNGVIGVDISNLQQSIEAVCGTINDAKARSLASSMASSLGTTIARLANKEAFNAGCQWRGIISRCGALGTWLTNYIQTLVMGTAAGAGLNICTQISNISVTNDCSIDLAGCADALSGIAGLAAPKECVKALNYTLDGNLEKDGDTFKLKKDAQIALCVLCGGIDVQPAAPTRPDGPAPTSPCQGKARYVYVCGEHTLDDIEIEWNNDLERAQQKQLVADYLVQLYKLYATKGVAVLKSLINTALKNRAQFRSNVLNSLTNIDNPTGDVPRILLLEYLSRCSNVGCNKLISSLTPNDECIDKIQNTTGNVPRNDWPTGTKKITLNDAINLGIDLENIDSPNNEQIAEAFIRQSIGDDGEPTYYNVQCAGADVTSVEAGTGEVIITYQFPPSAAWSSGITNVGDCKISDFREKMKRIVDALNASRTPCGGHSPLWNIVRGFTEGAPLQPIGFGGDGNNTTACLYKWPNEVDNKQRTGVGDKDAVPDSCIVYPGVYDRTKRESFVIELYILTKILPDILGPSKEPNTEQLFRQALTLINSLKVCG